jgi:hypothetical protein
MSASRTFLCFFLLWCGNVPLLAGECVLRPMAEQLQMPELRFDNPQGAMRGYRVRLLRFVNAYYGAIAQDILRGDGEYWLALQKLMGSTGDGCLSLYRQTLAQEATSQDFGLALWTLRVAAPAYTLPAQVGNVILEQ